VTASKRSDLPSLCPKSAFSTSDAPNYQNAAAYSVRLDGADMHAAVPVPQRHRRSHRRRTCAATPPPQHLRRNTTAAALRRNRNTSRISTAEGWVSTVADAGSPDRIGRHAYAAVPAGEAVIS